MLERFIPFRSFSSADRYWRDAKRNRWEGEGENIEDVFKYLGTVRKSMFAITCGRTKANTYKLGSAQQAVMTHINPN